MATSQIVRVVFKGYKKNLTKPVVHPEIRNSVPHGEVHPAEVGSDEVQSGAHQEKTQITQSNVLGVFSLIQRAARVEMVDTAEIAVRLALTPSFGLTFVVVVTSDVNGEIHEPAEQLLGKQAEGGQNGGFLHQLAHFMNSLAETRRKLLSGLGNENHITT